MPTEKPTPKEAFDAEVHFSMTPFIDAQQRSLKALLDIQGQAMERLAKMNSEYTTFMRMRIEADCKAAADTAACRTPQEALTVSTAFVETAVKQYGEEMSALASLCFESINHSVKAVPALVPDVPQPKEVMPQVVPAPAAAPAA